MIPAYKENYKSSIGVLYRPLQDIEIYVEDAGSEVFYNQLLGRLLNGEVRVKKIIPLGGKTSELKAVASYDTSYPRAFITDADLYWVSNTFENTYPRLFHYDFYCIENVLFCKEAAATIVQETTGNIAFDDALTALNWDSWIEEISTELIDLFILFATSFKLEPSIPTVSRNFDSIITQQKKGLPKIDQEKTNSIKTEIRDTLLLKHSESEIDNTINEIKSKMDEHGINIVSGKNFLLPLLTFKIKEACNCNMNIESRNFRLAKHCNLTPLQPLKDFLKKQVQTN